MKNEVNKSCEKVQVFHTIVRKMNVLLGRKVMENTKMGGKNGQRSSLRKIVTALGKRLFAQNQYKIRCFANGRLQNECAAN